MQTDTSADTANGNSRTKVWSFRAFGKLMRDRTILMLVAVFLAGMVGLLWQVHRMQSNLVDTFALQEASLYSDAIGQFRSIYTSEVVKRAKAFGMEITHDYETKEGAIPLPATLSMALGNRIATSKFRGKTKLYSQYPFPWRRETGGLTDQFSKDAWQHLTQEPDKPYYRFESDQGTPSLRHATADIMQASCITCHNTHPETPKNDWRVGDVRGVLEVSIPLDVAIAETRSGLRGTFALLAGMGFFGLTALVIVIGKLRRTTDELEQRVVRRTGSLGESEARVRAIVESAADGIVTINEAGIIQSFNGAAESTFGYSEQEVIGENVSILMPSPYREEHDAFLQRYLDTGVKTILSERREVTGCRKDGTVFPMDLTASESRVGDRRMFTGIVRDITERKKAEEKLRRFRAAIDTSADGIFLIDRQSMRFVDASKSACDSVGYIHDEILALGPDDIKPEFTKDQLAAKFETFAQRQTTGGVMETEHRRKDGSTFPVEIMLRFLERDGQQIVIEVVRDITERKWAEEELWRSRHEIEEANTHLTESVRELETFNTLAVGRELRMIELKEEVNALLSQKGESPKYEIVGDEVAG